MKVKLLPPLEHVHSGCLNCGSKPVKVKMNARLHPGFGGLTVLRDGKAIRSYYSSEDEDPTFIRFENMARKDPDHDWRVKVDAPLYEVTYQRHGRNEWFAVEKGMGFA